MIYDIKENTLSSVYTKSGVASPRAYNTSGEKVYPPLIYENYSFSPKWVSKGISATQGFDIYDGKAFWVSKSGNASIPANCYVWNLSDGSQALPNPYITVYSGHGNNLCFDFPKLYATSAYTPHVYINTLTSEFEATLSQTLYLNDGCKDCDACIDETDKTILWSLGHDTNDTTDNNNPRPYLLSKWDLTQLTDNGDGTYTPYKISTVLAERPSCYFFQGCKFHDGLLWYASGYAGSSTKAYVYAVNPLTGSILYTIDCETTSEPEGVAWVPDAQSVGGYALYVGFQGMMLRKYTFS